VTATTPPKTSSSDQQGHTTASIFIVLQQMLFIPSWFLVQQLHGKWIAGYSLSEKAMVF